MIFLSVILIISSIYVVLLYRMEYICSDKTICRFKYLIFLLGLCICVIILRPCVLRVYFHVIIINK